MVIDNDLVGFFNRHIVPIFFSFKKGNDIQNNIYTTFVLSIKENWFLITAGHCISDINNRLENGYKIKRSELIDFLGSDPKHKQPIPFIYKDSNPLCLSDDYAFDYGVMTLSPYYQRLLLANDIQALSEEVWKKQPHKVDFYTLLGIPTELFKVKRDSISLAPMLFSVEAIDHKPEGFSDVEAPLFYGRIVLGDKINSIRGMSGGPIFGFQKNDKGEIRYWLIALQSRWLPESHFIAACPTKLLGNFLEDI